MSKRLSEIRTSCPIFDKALASIKEIEDFLGEKICEQLGGDINTIIDCIEECRGINGDLRDTCSDIIDEKDKEIANTTDEKDDEISKLEDKIYELEREIEELKSNA